MQHHALKAIPASLIVLIVPSRNATAYKLVKAGSLAALAEDQECCAHGQELPCLATMYSSAWELLSEPKQQLAAAAVYVVCAD